MRSDSSVYGRLQRLTTKPGESEHLITVRSMRSATSVAAASVTSSVRSPATTSTSLISAGGLKKCIPQIRSGRSLLAAISVTAREEVFVASTAAGPQAASRRANNARFKASSSGAASITNSQSVSPSMDSATASRAIASAASSALQRPRSAPRARSARSRSRPAGERLRLRIVERDLEPAEAGQLGDPGAHRPGAGDADAGDAHDGGGGGGASPSQNSAASRRK